jgi:hypothetical protein
MRSGPGEQKRASEPEQQTETPPLPVAGAGSLPPVPADSSAATDERRRERAIHGASALALNDVLIAVLEAKYP